MKATMAFGLLADIVLCFVSWQSRGLWLTDLTPFKQPRRYVLDWCTKMEQTHWLKSSLVFIHHQPITIVLSCPLYFLQNILSNQKISLTNQNLWAPDWSVCVSWGTFSLDKHSKNRTIVCFDFLTQRVCIHVAADWEHLWHIQVKMYLKACFFRKHAVQPRNWRKPAPGWTSCFWIQTLKTCKHNVLNAAMHQPANLCSAWDSTCRGRSDPSCYLWCH